VVQGEPTTVVLFASNFTIAAVGGLAMPFVWQSPSGRDLALMLLVGAFGAGGQFLTTEALRRAPATVIAPISFSSLIWAFFLGLAIWGEVPGLAVFAGAALILASGGMVTLAEWLGTRRPRAVSAAAGD
jgi:drug/metabolite transporter (DMT)-like permease